MSNVPRKSGDPGIHKFRPAKRDYVSNTVLDDATRQMLLKEVMENPRTRRVAPVPTLHKDNVTQAPHAVKGAEVDSGVDDLMSTMLQRLRTIEVNNKVLQQELKEKSGKIIELEDRHAHERICRKKAEAEVNELCEANKQLRVELREIHEFLADYGLTWVGGPAVTPRDMSGHGPPHAEKQKFDLYTGSFVQAPPPVVVATQPSGDPLTPSVPKLNFDLEKVKKNCAILTAHIGSKGLMGEGMKKMLKERDTVYLCIYADGICVNSGPFRPYGWPLCDAILGDVLEGFYPYEFKDTYPDGFPIEIVDRSTDNCPRHNSAGDADKFSNLDKANDHGYKPITMNALMKRLPEQYVTAGGQLINIRDGVSQFLKGGTAPETSTCSLMSPVKTAASEEVSRNPNASNITAVQIRLPSGQKVVLHMFFHNTISEVRRELSKVVLEYFSVGFELCSVFPRKTYDDHAMTLEALGLVPNCTLMIKILDKKTFIFS